MANPKVHLRLLKNPIHFLALGFGSGLARFAPGTFGTLAALPLLWLLHTQLSMLNYAAVTLLFAVVGVWICRYTANALGVHDHPAIVWDEVCGILIAMVALPLTWLNVLVAFVLFRFFDIVKPGPIGWCDRNLHGGLGIMVDDILAGVAAGATLHLGYALLNTFQ
ncbi:phosphatidylglycerophosphatase A [Pseudidiomarina aestuarii]|uniref:Phosphatidylglycerophosphatase A n=1 Tax=Pseudidiomarina aestuarii TaxID=624146 RepID=A0A7Z7ESP7_9GAMM|nr:phosphatidylglycerophosphatase A [Pseudidiomarina aestuarii]RUO39163.1 phosphatidylglycerophosphatase A [Pseudidiomarina aestuarii]